MLYRAFVILVALAPAARAQWSPRQFEPVRLAKPENDEVHASVIQQTPWKGQILPPLLLPPTPPPPPDESLLSKVFRHLVIPLQSGPLFLLPLVDRYKDLGFTYGLMPIWAVRGKNDQVNQVYAPSVLYNRYLRTTATWRGYYFPDDKKLFVSRFAISEQSDREVFLRYFDPEFRDSRYRVNAEFHYLVSGRPSFYGFGPSTLVQNQANYAYQQLGEEMTVDVPIAGDFFMDLSHSYYTKRAEDGPITTVQQVSVAFPADFAFAHQWSSYLFHQAAIVYDSTDHAALPRRGFYANVSAGTSQASIGSSFTYQQYGAELKKYFNIDNGKYITAFHAQLQQQTGEALPFYQQQTVGESTGLRVVGDGRYVDRGRLLFSLEERFRLSEAPFLKFVSEMELTPFVDSGTVFHDPSAVKFNIMHWAYGSSFRLVLRPQVVGTVDLALGHEGPNVIVHVGYPF
jgi:hypothetical protein